MFTEWVKKINAWRRNQHHMWLERKERKQFLGCLETLKLEGGAEKEIKAFYERQCFYDCPTFPYDWAHKKNAPRPEVFFDREKGMCYADWHGKRLYWKKGVPERDVRGKVSDLLMEQHEKSPHRYEFPPDITNAVIADLGAAEGCFTLDRIDRIDHAYLFECDEDWEEPLKATFEPCKEKVTIIRKYIGTEGGNDYTTLDAFFADKSLDFVKADIEGAEIDMLTSGEYTFTNKVRGASICLYHNPTDEQEILALLHKYGFTCNINPGYMLFRNTQDPKTWLRRGVVQAKRI